MFAKIWASFSASVAMFHVAAWHRLRTHPQTAGDARHIVVLIILSRVCWSCTLTVGALVVVAAWTYKKWAGLRTSAQSHVCAPSECVGECKIEV